MTVREMPYSRMTNRKVIHRKVTLSRMALSRITNSRITNNEKVNRTEPRLANVDYLANEVRCPLLLDKQEALPFSLCSWP
jgi:hypothetical protein